MRLPISAFPGANCHLALSLGYDHKCVGVVGFSNFPILKVGAPAPSRMRCPKCQFDHELQTTDCLKCGIVFSRYKAPTDAGETVEQGESAGRTLPTAPLPSSASAPPTASAALSATALPEITEPLVDRTSAFRELKYRALALPLALLFAWLVTSTGLRIVAGMLAMVVHESGHAITAWLTGRWAVPLLWVTMHGDERSWSVVLILTSVILFGGYLAWRMERWGWVCIAGAVLIVQLIFLSLPNPGALIVFGGDGGALVLATILMATFYAPRESALYRSWGLRWGLLVYGALAFLHVFRTWSGPMENLPFGEIEGVNLSDPSLLTEMYGWSVLQLVDRYVRLGTVCLVVLLALYVWGLLSAYLETRLPAPQGERAQASRLPRSAAS